MKNTGIVILYCILVLVFIPLLNIRVISVKKHDVNLISVFNVQNNEVSGMDIEEYVLKVLEKEMPVGFHHEALKAQAIAIRTYSLKKKNSDIAEHNGADVCTDYKHCMAYMDDEKLTWGDKADDYIEKYKKAVSETEGLILTYDDEIVSAFFHSMSGGKTQNCKDVWGTDIPYLRTVNSEYDKLSNGFETKKEFLVNELSEKLSVNFSDSYIIENYESGYVKTIKIDGKEFSGKEMRDILELRSSCFKVDKSDGKYIFTVYGYGHGVGLSQHGANIMAQQGKDYKEILYHYYPGTQLKELEQTDFID